MKRLIIGSLSFLLLSTAIAPVIRAETQAINSATLNQTLELAKQLTPFELVYLANQGYLSEQGIPSSMGLISAYQMGTVRAEKLVEAAIKANKLSPQLATDRGYLNTVEFLLRTLTTHH
ncbi:MAG TPA: hypothetical protein V6D28_06535 [Leptolyngbyaceae cyanobacterium]